ncbi:hypothetical protein CEXT_154131 [Caerostris extrusa]|uniref:Uncharacterized protein n=1 Tax=Caerostris extrusa TaxID=172846 RepID=A0AAV4R9T1_CAEEX|nr:hypothetical protein CEXT_154131 [Caerostris extrusa]
MQMTNSFDVGRRMIPLHSGRFRLRFPVEASAFITRNNVLKGCVAFYVKSIRCFRQTSGLIFASNSKIGVSTDSPY